MRERHIGKDELVDQLEVEESRRRMSNRRRWRSGRAASGVWRLLRVSDLLGAAMELQRLRASGRGAATAAGERPRSCGDDGRAAEERIRWRGSTAWGGRPADSGDEKRDEREGLMAGSTQKTISLCGGSSAVINMNDMSKSENVSLLFAGSRSKPREAPPDVLSPPRDDIRRGRAAGCRCDATTSS